MGNEQNERSRKTRTWIFIKNITEFNFKNMKNLVLFAILFSYIVPFTFSQGEVDQKTRLEKHVYYFAADSLNGRKTGSKDNKKVAQYIQDEFNQIGLKTEMQFINQDNSKQNVIGIIEGSDPILKNEVIVIGAHYDHLGVKNGKVYNGADDNASGTATIIEIARNLSKNREILKRTIVFVAFDAEEIGLVGSSVYVDYFLETKQSQKVVLMMSLDMVGYLKQSGKLRITGVKTLENYTQFFDKVKFDEKYRLDLQDFDNSIFTGSDHGPFLTKKIPAFHVTTGLKSPYHKPEDDAHLIDYEGLSIITDYFSTLISVFATEPILKSSSDFGKPALGPKNNYLGLIVGFGNNQHFYKYGTMTGKPALSLSGGIYGKLSLGQSYSLKGEIDYEYTKGNRMEGVTTFHSVSVPLTLFTKITVQDMVEFSSGIGGYYTYHFAGKLKPNHLNTTTNIDFSTYNPHELGFLVELEMRTAMILFGVQWRLALTDVKINPLNNEISHINGFNIRIGYVF